MEERSPFRRRIPKTTSSLSVCRESIPDSSRIMTGWFSRRSGSRVSIHNAVRLRVLRAPSLSRNPMPPRITRKSDRRKVSDRTMVGTCTTTLLVCVRNRRASLRQHDESAGKGNSQNLVTLLGLDGKHLVFCRRRRGICLDILFYRTALPECGNLANRATVNELEGLGATKCVYILRFRTSNAKVPCNGLHSTGNVKDAC